MRVKSLLVFILFTVHCTLFGQIMDEFDRIDSDSLLNILPGLEGTNRIDALNQIAFDYSRDKPDSAITISLETINLSESVSYEKGVADAHLSLGLIFLFKDSLRPSVINFLEALNIYEEIDTCLGMGIVYHQLQVINSMIGRYDISKQYGRKAIKVFNTLSYPFYEVEVIILQGLTYTMKNEFDSSEYILRKGLAILDKYPRQRYRIFLHFNIGFNYVWIDDLSNINHPNRLVDRIQTAIEYSQKAIDLSEKIQDSIIYSVALENLCILYGRLGTEESRKKDRQCTYKLIEYAETRKVRAHTLMSAYRHLGLLEYRDGNIGDAIRLTKKAIKRGFERSEQFVIKDYGEPINIFLHRNFFKRGLRNCYNLLYEYYMEIGDHEKALEYYMLENEINKQIIQKETQNLVAMLEADAENEKTENYINMLERDKEISQLQALQSRNLNIGIGIIFLILILVGILFIRQSKLKNEHKSTLLEQKLLRLQMNPHFIFNALSNIMHAIEEDSKQSALSYLSKFSKLLRTNLESSRQDYILLEDEITSITHYMELQQLRYENKFDYSIKTGDEIDLENAIIPPMLIQPFIENAIEHGIRHKEEKGNITIRFTRKGEKIHCEIEDDGVGRENAWEAELKHKEHKSLATDIIRDRLAVLNKKLKQKIQLSITDLKSDTDQAIGTLVRLDLPYLLD